MAHDLLRTQTMGSTRRNRISGIEDTLLPRAAQAAVDHGKRSAGSAQLSGLVLLGTGLLLLAVGGVLWATLNTATTESKAASNTKRHPATSPAAHTSAQTQKALRNARALLAEAPIDSADAEAPPPPAAGPIAANSDDEQPANPDKAPETDEAEPRPAPAPTTITLDITSKPKGAEVWFSVRGKRARRLCQTPCRKRVSVPGDTGVGLTVTKPGCGQNSFATQSAHDIKRHFVLKQDRDSSARCAD